MATMIDAIDAKPFRFPIEGSLDPARIAFIAIDMQVDFCGEGGLVDRWGRLAAMQIGRASCRERVYVLV